MMSAMLRSSPAESNTATPLAANAAAFSSALVWRSRSTIANCVPASADLIPWSANAASTAMPSSISIPTARIAAPALFVSASENCCTLALARVLAFTSTSVTRVRFSRFCCASLTVNPNADCASVARSVASDKSNMPACANLATWGKAAIDCCASNPAEARK